MGAKASVRNPVVELLRFVFAIMIFMFHTFELDVDDKNFLFKNGYIAVEFFFILSGYFAAKAAMRPCDDASAGKWALTYTLKKYAAFMPAVIISVILCFAAQVYVKAVGLSDFTYAIFEMLLLPQDGNL